MLAFIQRKIRNKKRSTALWLLFAAAFAATVALSVYLEGTYLNADASSELVFGELMHREGVLNSKNWYGSTRVSVLGVGQMYALLFCFFSDYAAVHVVGNTLLLSLFCLSYFFFAKSAGLSERGRVLGGTLLLCLPNATYAYFMAYAHAYTSLYTLCFMAVGFFFRLCRAAEQRKRIGCLIGMLAFGLLTGLSGVESTLLVMLPLCAAAAVCWLFYGGSEKPRYMGYAALLMAACAAGVAVYLKGFASVYAHANDLGGTQICDLDLERMGIQLTNLPKLFGFRGEVNLFSLTGILNILAAGVSLLMFGFAAHAGLRRGVTAQERLPYLLTVCLFALPLLIAMFSNTGFLSMHYLMYGYVFLVPMGAEAILRRFGPPSQADDGQAADAMAQQERKPDLQQRLRLCAVLGLVLLCFFAEHALTVYSFVTTAPTTQGTANSFWSPGNINNVGRRIGGAADFLTQEGYDTGFSTFLHANTLTHKTNGQIRVIPIMDLRMWKQNEQGRIPIAFYDWLTYRPYRERVNGRSFLLLTCEEWAYAQGGTYVYDLRTLVPVYADEAFVVLELPDGRAFMNCLRKHLD